MYCMEENIIIYAFIICVLSATVASLIIDKAIEKYTPKKKRGRPCKTSIRN